MEQTSSRPQGRPRQALTGHALDRWMRDEGLTLAQVAERIRIVRGHPTSPALQRVSEWMRGVKSPSERMRIAIEVASQGAVRRDTWAQAQKENA